MGKPADLIITPLQQRGHCHSGCPHRLCTDALGMSGASRAPHHHFSITSSARISLKTARTWIGLEQPPALGMCLALPYVLLSQGDAEQVQHTFHGHQTTLLPLFPWLQRGNHWPDTLEEQQHDKFVFLQSASLFLIPEYASTPHCQPQPGSLAAGMPPGPPRHPRGHAAGWGGP